MASDIEIAQAAIPQPIGEIADKLSIPDEALEPYGRIKGKVSLDWLLEQPVRDTARMILVTAISPTPSGEGKTTTTVGLGDALRHIGKDAVICLREFIIVCHDFRYFCFSQLGACVFCSV